MSPPSTHNAIDESAVLDGALAFLGEVWALAHALDSRSKWMSARIGVTGPQRMAIRLIGRVPGIPAGALARYLRLHPSTLTGVLHRLEERGFVARAKDSSDSRRSMFVLTGQGRAIDATREGTVEHAVERVLARHSPEDVALVKRVLGDLARELLSGID